MPYYMVVAAFTGEPDTALLPAERERLKELADGGILRAVYLSADRSGAWLVVRGDDPNTARNAMESLPLYSYMEIQGIAEVKGTLPPTG